MFGISINELIVIMLLMVIFIKPKDIPSVVNFLAKIIKKVQEFVFEIRRQINSISSDIDETKDMVEENFQIQQEPEFVDVDEVKKTPKLIDKKKPSNKKTQK